MLLTGGGTGGHITPLLAVAHELRRQQSCEIVYIGEHNGKFAHLTDGHHDIDAGYSVYAGKFRRYHGQSWLLRMLDVRTNLLNLRDFFYFIVGTFQAWRILGKVKPDVIFLKGGFVGVPVGIAAHWRKIPFITHDSDSQPGLANRIISRWARLHATAAPAEEYPYPQDKTKQVGVLVGADYQPVDDKAMQGFRADLNLPPEAQVILVTGGSLGANRLNAAFISIADGLLQDYPELYVIHQVGKGKLKQYGDYTHQRLTVQEFLTPLYKYSGAADVVVTRAGANTLAELGVQGKPCIIVPNPQLTEGHQNKNAAILAEENAAVVVDESMLPSGLDDSLRKLLQNSSARAEYAQKIRNLTIPDAAARVARFLIDIAQPV